MAIVNSYVTNYQRVSAVSHARALPASHVPSSRRQQGSMGAQSQEGSLYMTEERFQKIRIAAAARHDLAGPAKNLLGELSWNELKNRNIYIYIIICTYMILYVCIYMYICNMPMYMYM